MRIYVKLVRKKMLKYGLDEELVLAGEYYGVFVSTMVI